MRQQVRVHYENGVEVTRIEEEAGLPVSQRTGLSSTAPDRGAPVGDSQRHAGVLAQDTDAGHILQCGYRWHARHESQYLAIRDSVSPHARGSLP